MAADALKAAKLGAIGTISAAVVGALIAGVFQIASAQLGGGDKKSDSAPPPASAAPSPGPVPGGEPPPTPEPAPSDTPSGEPADGGGGGNGGSGRGSGPADPPPAEAEPPTVRYLGDIEGTRHKSATLVHEGRQRRCPNSLMIAAHLFQRTKSLEYAIEPGWDTFRAVAGIDTAPPSGNRMRFTVYVDDRQAAVHELSDREAVEIEVPVAGGSQLKLVTETIEAGEVPKGGYGAWGDARFTRGEGPHEGC